VPRFFFEERLNLADGGLSQIDDVHEGEEIHAALPRHSIIKEVKVREKVKEVREETQRNALPREALEKMC
jgi:hypothetical protein